MEHSAALEPAARPHRDQTVLADQGNGQREADLRLPGTLQHHLRPRFQLERRLSPQLQLRLQHQTLAGAYQRKHHPRGATAPLAFPPTPLLHLRQQVLPRKVLLSHRRIHSLHLLLRRLPSRLLRQLPLTPMPNPQLHTIGVLSDLPRLRVRAVRRKRDARVLLLRLREALHTGLQCQSLLDFCVEKQQSGRAAHRDGGHAAGRFRSSKRNRDDNALEQQTDNRQPAAGQPARAKGIQHRQFRKIPRKSSSHPGWTVHLRRRGRTPRPIRHSNGAPARTQLGNRL